MAGEFVPSGVELAAKGLGQFLSDLKTADNAIAKVGSGVAISAAPFVDIGNAILDVGVKATQVAAGGLAILAATVVAIGVDGTKSFIELEQGLADIHAISGDTAEVVAPLGDLISELALDPNLKVTTDQATQAMYSLTKQGLEVEQIMDGAGRATVELANATGAGFAPAGTIAAGVMKAWGLEASEFSKVADGITGVLTNSKFTIDDYNLAFAQGGGLAASYGVSLEDFNTIVAGTAGIFSSGSDAGTSFKTMLLAMASPTKEAKAVMEQYGISLFNADGSMRDMREVAAQLNQVMEGNVTITSTVGGVTEEVAKAAEHANEALPDLNQTLKEQAEKLDILKNEYALTLQYYDPTSTKARNLANQIDSLTYDYNKNLATLGEYQGAIDEVNNSNEQQISTTRTLTDAEKARLTEAIGGRDAARMLVELGKLSAEEYDKLSQTVNASGQAMNAAAIRMDTTSGALEILQGVIEAVQLQIGEKFTPMVKGAAEAMTQWVSDNSGPIIAFFGNIATGIENVIGSLVKIGGAFAQGGLEGATISLMDQLGFDQESVDKVTEVINTITSEIDRIKLVFQQFGASGVAFSIGGLLGLDSDSMIAMQDTITNIIASITAFAEQVRTVLSGMGLEELKGAIIGVGAVLATGIFAAIVAGLVSLMTPINLIIAGAALLGAAWAGNWGGIQEITYSVIDAMMALGDWWNENLPVMQAVAMTAWKVITSVIIGFQEALGPVTKQLQEQFTQIGNTLSELGIEWSDVWDAIVRATGIVAAAIGAAILLIIGVVAGLANGIASGISAVITMFQELSSNVAGIIDGLTLILSGWIDTFTAIFAGDIPGIMKGLEKVLDGILMYWTNTFEGMANVILGALNIIIETTSGFKEGFIGFFQNMYDELVGHSIIPDMIDAILKLFKDLPKKILSALGTLVETVTKPFVELGNIIEDKLGDAFNGLINTTLPLLQEGFDYVTEGVKNFISSIREAANELTDMVIPDWLEMHSPPPLATALNMVADSAGLASGAINTLMTGMKVTDESFIDRFIDDLNMGGIGKAAGAGGGQWKNFRNILINEITAGMSGLESGTINFMDKITEVANRFQFPPNLAREFAEAEGLVEHLTGTFSAMFQKLKIENLAASIGIAGNFNSIAGSFAGMLESQIEAFNQSTEDAIKLKDANEKLTEGYSEQQNKLAILEEELARLTTGNGQNAMAIEKTTEALAFGERQLEIYNEELAALTPDTLAWDKKKLAIDKLTETMDMQRQELEKLQAQNAIDVLSIEKKTLAIAELTEEMDDNREAIAKNEDALAAYRMELAKAIKSGFNNPWANEQEEIASDLAMMELLQEFIDSGIESLRLYGNETEGMFANTGLSGLWTQVYAQEELNRLLAEQEERERMITEQKEAQQKIDKLMQQINLMKLISDRGLNPADILEGITLGLDAGAAELLEVTNRIVNAMIEEIDQGFKLGSPSHLMYDKFSDVVEGARMALEDGVGVMGKAMGDMLTPVYDMSSMLPGMSTINNSQINYNFPMTVNTAASASAVTRLQEIKRSMYASS